MEISLRKDHLPRVLLVGNGLLQLNGGVRWDELIEGIKDEGAGTPDMKSVPFCMQPEMYFGADTHMVQQKVKEYLSKVPLYVSPQMERLLSFDFDCVLTTNYTYEIESVLTGGKWNEGMRRKALTALDGSKRAWLNNSLCYMVTTTGGKTVPVFHIHGDWMRTHSLILSYYSYAQLFGRLQECNRMMGNAIQEAQREDKALAARSWLEWYLAGDVYAIGYGNDFSEIDMWWALERKKREKAHIGRLRLWDIYDKKSMAGEGLLKALGGEHRGIPLAGREWAAGYDEAIAQIADELEKR